MGHSRWILRPILYTNDNDWDEFAAKHQQKEEVKVPLIPPCQ